jgi:peptidoglycan/LPS O-acetylase OafA/YrhL
LYLSHWFVLSILGKVFGALQLSPSLEIPIRGLGIAISIGFALMVYRYVEQPIESRLRRNGPFQASGRRFYIGSPTLKVVASQAKLAQPADLAPNIEIQVRSAYPPAFRGWVETSDKRRDI